nr:Bifunctional protein FolD protein [Chlamydiota bacterium]
MVINGKKIADEIRGEIKKSIAELKSPRKPGLAFLLVGHHAPSHTYVNMKKKACADVGIESHVYELPETITEQELLKKIEELRASFNIAVDEKVVGAIGNINKVKGYKYFIEAAKLINKRYD